MFPNLTIYTVNADVSLLNAILNGVAMVCTHTALIWGFALMAATWRLVHMSGSAVVNTTAGSGGNTGMQQGAFGLFLPFFLAILITSPSLQTKVIVESSINGTLTQIDNVPSVIAVVPATASTLSQQVGAVVETAFQGTGTNYASISASGSGFINPLKTLLTSRTAILKLGSINSEVNSVISACLGSDKAPDYSSINQLVMFAGNTGALSAQSLMVYDQAGSYPTSIGALLYQASQNATGIITDTSLIGSNSFITCYDAAYKVAANINTALYSQEFARIIQGAVNSADQPNVGANYSITGLASIYEAVRTANTTTNTLAGGVGQANAEVVNLLFSEMVRNDLDCLKADSTNKTTCLAMAIQSNEIERNNIQSAANGVEGLLYAGQFSNYITALIIGLGPVIVLFMMFSGVEAGKNMKVAVHMIVWPLLIMNVGAELINGMIYNTVANFMTTVAHAGYINQATAVEVYKNFSLQIGTASHLISTLPILMATIFALGESSAMVSISNSMGSNSTKESDAANPAAINNAPLVSNGSLSHATQGYGFTDNKATGALDAVSTSSQYGNLTNDANHALTSALATSNAITEGTQDLASWQESFKSGDYSKFGITHTQGESIKNNYESALRNHESFGNGTDIQGSRGNTNQSSVTGKAGGSVGFTKEGIDYNIGAGVDGTTGTSATDSLTANTYTKHDAASAQSQSLLEALNKEKGDSSYNNTGNDKDHSIQKSLSTQKTFSTALSKTTSFTDTVGQLLKNTQSFNEMSQKIGAPEIANQVATNADYKMFQSTAGRAFDRVPGVNGWKTEAEKRMDSGATDSILNSNPAARDAVLRHSAAVFLANDPNAKPEDKLAAEKFLINSAQSMQKIGFSRDLSLKNTLPDPINKTSVNAGALIKKGNHIPLPDKAPKNSVHQEALNLESQIVSEVPHNLGLNQATVNQDTKTANNAGLGHDGHGTVIRTGANLGANTGVGDSRTNLNR